MQHLWLGFSERRESYSGACKTWSCPAWAGSVTSCPKWNRIRMPKKILRRLLELFAALASASLPALAQQKNEVGLVIGATLTPSQILAPGQNLTGPGGKPNFRS